MLIRFHLAAAVLVGSLAMSRADGLNPAGTAAQGLCKDPANAALRVPCVLQGQTWTRVLRPTDPIDGATVGGRAVSAILGDKAPLVSPTFSGTVSVSGSVAAVAAGASTIGGIFPGQYVFANNNNDSLVGSVLHNRPAGTISYDTGVTGYGRLAAGSAGNQIFGIFARADCYDKGTCTNEVNAFNITGADAPSAYPWDRSIGTGSVVPVALTVACGGDKVVAAIVRKKCAAGIEVAQEGEAPTPFQYGMVMRKDAANLAGIYMDADDTVSPKTNVVLRNSGLSGNLILDMQTVGATVPGNAVMRHRNSFGTTTLQMTADGNISGTGDVTGTTLHASSGNFPVVGLNNTAAALNEKSWEWQSQGSSLVLRAVNDAYTASDTAMSIGRSGFTVSGIAMPKNLTVGGTLSRDGAAGTTRDIAYASGGKTRWMLNTNATAETGSNAGSNFEVRYFSDAGTFLGVSFYAIRSTGDVVFNRNVSVGGLLQIAPYTVAGLPVCNSATRDGMAVVTDATAPTYRGALTGGGTVRTPVYCDGTSWTAH